MLLVLSNIVPETIALLSTLFTAESPRLFYACSLWLICSIILRPVWNSAIVVHGLGHTMAIALADRELSAINLTRVIASKKKVKICQN